MGAYIDAVTDALRWAPGPLTVEQVYRCAPAPPATARVAAGARAC
jgi:hypothetical protein